MKPENVNIISISTERIEYGTFNGEKIEIYGLGDDGVIYFYGEEEQKWVVYTEV